MKWRYSLRWKLPHRPCPGPLELVSVVVEAGQAAPEEVMLQHPILINRPIVVTPVGTRLCRPSEVVLEIIPEPQQGAFTKEDGEKVIDEAGKRVK